MSEEEKIYQFNEYILGYDSGLKDWSCLTISKIEEGDMLVLTSIHGKTADLISMILDKLNEELQLRDEIIKEIREFAKLRKEMYERQENIIGQEVITSLLQILDKENK